MAPTGNGEAMASWCLHETQTSVVGSSDHPFLTGPSRSATCQLALYVQVMRHSWTATIPNTGRYSVHLLGATMDLGVMYAHLDGNIQPTNVEAVRATEATTGAFNGTVDITWDAGSYPGSRTG